jgi:YHS domain-containing protein/TusA-related sulfurtransferase
MNNKRFLALGLIFAVLAISFVFARTQSADTAKDPVCGMSVKIAGAKYTFDYKGTTYYFCSQGCKDSFSKNPDQYLAKQETAAPMAGHKMGMNMAGGQMGTGNMENCPFMLKDVEKKFENAKDGVIITLSSKNAETVKKIQDHAAQMKDMKAGAGKDEEGCPMAGGCPKMQTKKK